MTRHGGLRDSRERLPPDSSSRVDASWSRRPMSRGRASSSSRPAVVAHDAVENVEVTCHERAGGHVITVEREGPDPLGPDPDQLGRRRRGSRHLPARRRPRALRRLHRPSRRRASCGEVSAQPASGDIRLGEVDEASSRSRPRAATSRSTRSRPAAPSSPSPATSASAGSRATSRPAPSPATSASAPFAAPLTALDDVGRRRARVARGRRAPRPVRLGRHPHRRRPRHARLHRRGLGLRRPRVRARAGRRADAGGGRAGARRGRAAAREDGQRRRVDRARGGAVSA